MVGVRNIAKVVTLDDHETLNSWRVSSESVFSHWLVTSYRPASGFQGVSYIMLEFKRSIHRVTVTAKVATVHNIVFIQSHILY